MAGSYYIVDVNTKKAQKAVKTLSLSVKELEHKLIEGERSINNWKKALSKSTHVTKEDITKLEDLKHAQNEVKNSLKGAKLEQKEANENVKKLGKSTTGLSGSMKLLDKSTGGMVTAVKGSSSAFTGMIRGLGGVKIAVIGTGIGLLVIAVVSLMQAFKRSEEGQEKWERAMAMIGAVTNQILDGFAGIGEFLLGIPKMIKDAFVNPLPLLKSFGSGIVKFLKNPFKAVKDVIVDAKNSVVDFVEETLEEVDAMDKVTKARQKAHRMERELVVARAKANQEISTIRLEAEKRDIYSATQRIAMLKKAQDIEDVITEKEIIAKNLRVQALKEEMSLGLNSKQIKDDLAKLEAELIALDTKRTRGQRLLQTQITTAQNLELGQIEEVKQKKIQAELDFQAWKDDYELSLLSTNEEKHQRALLQIDQDFELKIAKAWEQFEAKMLTEEEMKEIEATLLKERDDKKLSYTQSVADKEFAIQKKKNLKKLSDDEKAERIKHKRMRNSLDAIVQLAGAESKIGRMALIGKNILAAKEMIIEAKKTISFSKASMARSVAAVADGTAKTAAVGFPQNIPMLLMYAVQAVGIIGAIKSAVKGAKKSTEGTGVNANIPEPATPVIPTIASLSEQEDVQAFQPSFNNLSTQGNQIAEALGTAPPVQAFVISQDVTTAQSLENNIITSASLG